jgi:hypothetical protein
MSLRATLSWSGLIIVALLEIGSVAADTLVAPAEPTVLAPPLRENRLGPSFDTMWKPVTPAPLEVVGDSKPQHYIAPGITGLYARLQASEARSRTGRFPNAKPGPLKPYQPYRNPDPRVEVGAVNVAQIVVKFVEGSGVRLNDGKLQVVADPSALETSDRLSRQDISIEQVRDDLLEIDTVLMQLGASVVAQNIDEPELDLLRRTAERNSGREMPDPMLFYFVDLSKTDIVSARKLLTTLHNLRSVELAYFQPIPYPAADIPPTTTIDVTRSQGYFTRAPVGIDANFARKFSGGRGDAVRIIDVESAWDDGHEDLPSVFFRIGVNLPSQDWANHGTAVLGELAAVENGFGANGVAPNAMIGWSSVTNLLPNRPIYFYSVGQALLSAATGLDVGDIALIEQQFVPPTQIAIVCEPGSPGCAPDCHDTLYVAVEEYPYEHAAISWLTSAGIIIVEAAGNGGLEVMPASTADSGAIVVGAATPSRRPFCWSNHGPRVNVSSWGGGIGTLGYGDDASLRANGGDANQWYTLSFGGTSGASPIVTGAAAIIQSTRAAVGLPRLTSIQMRDLLAATGSPQAAGTTPNVGPQPNLRAAIASFMPDAARFVQSQVPATAPVAPGATLTRTVTFVNSGGHSWTGDHTMSVARSGQSGVAEFTAATFTLGSTASPIDPGDNVVRNFSAIAPLTPGTYDLVFAVQDNAGRNLATSTREQIVVAVPGAPLNNAAITIDSFPGSISGVSPVNPPSGYKSGSVNVTVRNTGTTVWQPGSYALRLARTMRISVPQQSVALPNVVSPGGSASLTFTVTCTGTGLGSFSVQMSGGTQGRFGPSAGRNITCNP